MIKEAIILSGGFGTRLRDVVADLPKSMAPVNGKPFLDYILAYLHHHKIESVTMALGYMADKIIAQYGEKYNYSIEETPLGTGGGIRKALETCSEKDVLVLNGDSFFDIDLSSFFKSHLLSKADCSLALRNVDNAARYGTVSLTRERINAFKEKDGKEISGVISAGIYLLDRQKFLELTPPEKPFSIEKDFFEKQVSQLNICGFVYDGYFIDIGIPQDYEKAQHDFKDFRYK